MTDICSDVAGSMIASARREVVEVAHLIACGVAALRLALVLAIGAIGFFAAGVYLWLETVWPDWAASMAVAAVLAILATAALLATLAVSRRLAGSREARPMPADPLASLLGGGADAVAGGVRRNPRSAMLMAALAGVAAGVLMPDNRR
ncbi:MAG: phage holin family protein [Alphaproteobacteria bacterium]